MESFCFQLEATVPHRGSLANSLPHTATDLFRSGPDIRTEERRWLPFTRLEFDRVPSSAHSMAVLSPDECATYFENCTKHFEQLTCECCTA